MLIAHGADIDAVTEVGRVCIDSIQVKLKRLSHSQAV
jgi:hypothetical protein